eukprot:6208168-Pleurochrysis_carterae.AAC.4
MAYPRLGMGGAGVFETNSIEMNSGSRKLAAQLRCATNSAAQQTSPCATDFLNCYKPHHETRLFRKCKLANLASILHVGPDIAQTSWAVTLLSCGSIQAPLRHLVEADRRAVLTTELQKGHAATTQVMLMLVVWTACWDRLGGGGSV